VNPKPKQLMIFSVSMIISILLLTGLRLVAPEQYTLTVTIATAVFASALVTQNFSGRKR